MTALGERHAEIMQALPFARGLEIEPCRSWRRKRNSRTSGRCLKVGWHAHNAGAPACTLKSFGQCDEQAAKTGRFAPGAVIDHQPSLRRRRPSRMSLRIPSRSGPDAGTRWHIGLVRLHRVFGIGEQEAQAWLARPPPLSASPSSPSSESPRARCLPADAFRWSGSAPRHALEVALLRYLGQGQASPHSAPEATSNARAAKGGFPIIGKKASHEITTRDVLDVLRQPYRNTTLWDGARETASRVRMRIESVLNAEFALNRDHPLHRDAGSNFRNPAQWKNHLQVIFKAGGTRKKSHFEAMAFEKVPEFVAELQEKSDYSAKALMLTILCATRSNETLGARWEEIDWETGVWSIPAERMKAGRPHNVPLSDAAVNLLEKLPRIDGNPHLFPGAREKKPLSNMAMLMMLRGMREDEQLTVHGFRSAFRDWTGETTLHPDIIAEMALAHTIKDATVKAYRRGDAFERRKQLVQKWSDHITMKKSEYNVSDKNSSPK